MNREEKEQYVIQLYKENKSTREIAKIMHMSFRNIGAITKKVKSEADLGRGQLEEDEAGFETIAVTHSKDKEELAYKLGADSVVPDGKGLLEDQGRGADVILATSNSYKAVSDSIKGLRPDGRLILMGASATNEPLILSTDPLSPEFLFKRERVIGSTQNDREYLYEALDYVAKGKVRVMTEIFPLEEVNDVYDKVSNGNVRFKAVIEPIK